MERRLAPELPHVVDVQWRLDHATKGNNLESIQEPCYAISLKTEVRMQLCALCGVVLVLVCLCLHLLYNTTFHGLPCSCCCCLLQNGGVTKDIEFTCNIAELQDIVAALKDACKSVKDLQS